MRMIALAAVLATVFPSVQAQTTSLDTLAHFDVQPLGSYSAIWGYTAPDGREYAILGVNGSTSYQGGTSIIDITDTDSLREVAFIPGLSSSWREMKTYGHYAYVVTEAGGGVQIIDLSGLPDTAWLVRSFTYTNSGRSIAKSHTISIHDGYMYLNGCAQWSPGGMVIFDLHPDPETPEYAGEYQPEYIHDSYVLRDTIFASAIYSGGGLYIADARSKTSVQPIAKITYTGSGTHNAWVTKDRRYAVTTDEIGSTPKSLKVWDIGALPSVPANPVATFTPVPGQIEHNVTVRGNYAYVAWYSAGVRVVDLANPTTPLDAGGFDTSPTTSGYNGVWGVYPYFPSGKIIAGDMQNGLWVFRFSGLAPRVPVSLLEPADHDTLGSPASLTLRWTGAADRDRDPHWYDLSISGGALDTTFRVADTATVIPAAEILSPGVTYRWWVTVRDEWNETSSPDTFRFVYGLATGVSGSPGRPEEFRLGQNYPNPFNPGTTFQFTIVDRQLTTVRVYDLLGREVATLVDGPMEAGTHTVVFDGSGLASGVYLYRLTAGDATAVKRMVLMK